MPVLYDICILNVSDLLYEVVYAGYAGIVLGNILNLSDACDGQHFIGMLLQSRAFIIVTGGPVNF
jgi:hypothetical protein